MGRVVPIRIMDCISARNHVPKVLTYPIRIFYPDKSLDLRFGELKSSSLYISTPPYRFDDSRFMPEYEEGTGEDFDSLTDEIAQKIILDFKKFGRGALGVLVHCEFGQNRGPAIGLAINNIFQLGNDPEKIRKQFPDLREWMYEAMMRNGRLLVN